MKKCPVCLTPLQEISLNASGKRYTCSKCRTLVPVKSVIATDQVAAAPAVSTSTGDPSPWLWPLCTVGCLLTVAGVSHITPSVDGPTFLVSYIFFIFICFAVGSVLGAGLGQGSAGKVFAILLIEIAGFTRIVCGLAHDMHRFDVLFWIMVGVPLLMSMGSGGSGGSSSSSSGYGFWTCGSSCGSSCGGGGGCGGCGGH